MKMRHWFSGAALLGALVLAVFGLFGGAAVFFGLSSVIELIAAIANDKNSNV